MLEKTGSWAYNTSPDEAEQVAREGYVEVRLAAHLHEGRGSVNMRVPCRRCT